MTTQLVEQVGELDEETKANVLRQSLENMTVREALDLVKHLEKKWGVEASPNMVIPPGSGKILEVEEEKEQTEFAVTLTNYGQKKIAVVKAVRVLTGLSLKESKDVVDKAPVAVQEKLSREDADKAKAALEEAGATVELR